MLSKGKQRAPDNSDEEEYRDELQSDEEDAEDPNDNDLASLVGNETALAAQFKEEASPVHSILYLRTKDQQTPVIANENPAGARPLHHPSAQPRAQSRVPLHAHSTGSLSLSHPPDTSTYSCTDVLTT
jgi:hypothetical protein